MKKLLLLGSIALVIFACNSGGDKPADSGSTTSTVDAGNPSYDTARGEGKFKNVELSPTLEVAKAEAGEKVYDVKCASCHKLSTERLVGPGWTGVTQRNKPEWIMNFVTNVDRMLEQDPKAQAQLEICLVRMPNQNLTDEDARNVLEFMRKNDGIK